MNHVGRSHSQRTHTPRHTSPSVPLRDLTDAEVSEAIDEDGEQAYRVFHGLEVLPAVVGEHLADPYDLPASRPIRCGPAPETKGSDGAGSSGLNRKAAA